MTAMDDSKCATGIAGLDDILRGGFPARRLYLVQGAPGSGKTTLALQFLLMLAKFADHASKTLEEIKGQGLYKTERVITGPQNAEIPIADGRRVINLCANNYLGLADHPALIAAAKEALDSHGFGMASVRFICGTQDIHKELEAALTTFLGTEDTILYPSCFDANGGLFETLLGVQ